MKKNMTLVFVMLFCYNLFAADQIGKDTLRCVGGLGTRADAADTNGGGATKTAWDAGSPSDFIGANGGTIRADTGVTYTNGTTTFSATGIGTGVTVGTLAFVSGTNITTGIYEVTGQTNDTVVMADIVATGDNTDSVVNVGGALDTLQQALDDADGTSFNKYIFDSEPTLTVAATIDVDAFGGSSSSRVFIIGTNTSLVDDGTQITLTAQAAGALANGILEVDSGAPFGYVKNIIFDANTDGAAHCIVQDNTGNGVEGWVFENCRFTAASDMNIEWQGVIAGTHLQLINCEIDNAANEGWGIPSSSANRGRPWAINCKIHDNGSHGIYLGTAQTIIFGCQIYDNGGDGILTGALVFDQFLIAGNTITRNDGDGIDLNAASDNGTIFNNVAVNNGLVAGTHSYKFNGAIPLFFSYNLGSTTGSETAIADAVADGGFAALFTGNNIASTQTEDQIFVTVTDGSEDFTPETGSDLIDAGTDSQSTPTIDIGAIQLDAAGGGGGGGVVGVVWN